MGQYLMQGRVAGYIPELRKANPVHFGLCIKAPGGGYALEYLSRELHPHIFDSEPQNGRHGDRTLGNSASSQ